MTDLRRYQPGETATEVIDRLAAEIARLRAELVEKHKKYLREMAKVAMRDGEIKRLQAALAGDVRAMRASNARLFAALKAAVELADRNAVKFKDKRTEECQRIYQQCVAALALSERKWMSSQDMDALRKIAARADANRK
jgi:hypothetical protein